MRGTGSRKATEKKGVETDVLTEVKEMAVFTHWGLITQQNTDRNKGQAKKKCQVQIMRTGYTIIWKNRTSNYHESQSKSNPSKLKRNEQKTQRMTLMTAETRNNTNRMMTKSKQRLFSIIIPNNATSIRINQQINKEINTGNKTYSNLASQAT